MTTTTQRLPPVPEKMRAIIAKHGLDTQVEDAIITQAQDSGALLIEQGRILPGMTFELGEDDEHVQALRTRLGREVLWREGKALQGLIRFELGRAIVR